MHTSHIVQKILEKPYRLGWHNDSHDCLSMFLYFFEQCGIQMPHEWNGWTRENYAERWLKGEGRQEYMQFIHERTIPVDINFMRERDILIVESKDRFISIAIYLGNNHCIAITENIGVTVLPLWAIKPNIKEVRRIVKTP